MQITRFDEANTYEAPEHYGMGCLRRQGKDVTVEKIYVVIEGQVTVQTDTGEYVLSRLDSCRLAPSEARTLHNGTNNTASILLVVPN